MSHFSYKLYTFFSLILTAFQCKFLSYLQQNDYNYKNGGNDWSGICQNNYTQSPINIYENKVIEYNNFFFYVSDIEKNQASLSKLDENQFNVNGYFTKSFFINQFHNPFYYNMTSINVHSPSEHKINDKGFDLEVQFSGSYLNGKDNIYDNHFISFFFNATNENFTHGFIEQLIEIDMNKTNVSLDVSSVFYEDLTNYKTFIYEGSLTMPPCTEKVLWFVIATPQKIGVNQLTYFKNKWENNPEFANGRGNNRDVKNYQGVVYSNGGEF